MHEVHDETEQYEVAEQDEQLQQHFDNEVWQQNLQHEHDDEVIDDELVEVEQTLD